MPDESKTADLKPCPFCGEVAGGVFEHGGPNDHWVVECSACRGEYSEEGREAAITGWNRRVSPMSSNPEIADEWLPHPEATALQKAACQSMGAGQCAAICLSNLAPYGSSGCPEAHRVWKASAIWKEKQRRPSDGPLDQWTWSALANLGWSETYAE